MAQEQSHAEPDLAGRSADPTSHDSVNDPVPGSQTQDSKLKTPDSRLEPLDSQLAERLRRVVGEEFVLTDRDELLVFESDALTIHKCPPTAVIIPGSAEEVAAAVKVLADARVPFAPRGAGTGLSGGAL